MTVSAPISVHVEEREYLGWQAYWICRGKLDLVVTPSIGGRLMRLAWDGTDLAFTQKEFHGMVVPLEGITDIHAKKREFGFRLYGGDKTWLAPQTRWTDAVPFLDLDSGSYAGLVEKNSPEEIRLAVTSPVDRETGIQITRILKVAADRAGFELTHRLRNTSDQAAEWGIWDVFQCLKPGRVFLPRRTGSQFPEGVKTFAGEGESARVRSQVVQIRDSVVEIECTGSAAFKFGVDAGQGWLLGIHQGADGRRIGYRTKFDVFPQQPYGHGCTAEVYNSDRHPYFEMEIHGPLVKMGPGQETVLVEQRLLFEVKEWPPTEQRIRSWLEFAPA